MPYYENSNRGFLSQIPPVTRNLLLINIILFVATLVNEEFMLKTFALFYPASPLFRPWQLLTHMFMHGGWMHILFNMYALVTFGSILENNIGSRKFLVFYFVSGFGAVLLHLGVEYLQALSWSKAAAAGSVTAVSSYRAMLSTPTVGASGAIYGLLIAFAMLYPDAVLTLIFPPIPMKAKWWILIFAFLELGLGVFGSTDGIAHFAHLGGMVFGALLMIYWRRKGRLFQRDKWI